MVDSMSADRPIVAERNGISDYKSTPASAPKWNKPATLVPIPTNPTPHGRPSGTNPFSVRPGLGKNQPKAIGNRTSAQTLPNSNAGPSNKKARHDPTFTSAPNNRSHSKFPSTNRNIVHGNPRRSSVVPEQDIIHVVDDDSIPVSVAPEPVAGIKRPFSDGHSSDELNIISSRESGSRPHQPSKYPFSKESNKPTREERTSELVPDGKNTKMVDEIYGDDDVPDPIENYDSDREVQRPETSWSESIMREAQHRETRGSVKRIVEHIEQNNSGPKVDLKDKLWDKKSKNMKPNGQSRNQLKRIPVLQPMKVDSERSKHDSKIQDPVATGTTLRKFEQQGIPVKRVCIEHSEIPGNGLWAFSSPTVPLFIRDGDKELFNLSSWPLNSLDMEYTTGENPTIQLKCYADDSSPRILTIRFHVKNDAKGRYDKLFTRLKNAVPKAGIVRDDKHLWQLAEMHSAQTAAEHSISAKGKEPQFKKQKLLPSDTQPKLQFAPSDRYRPRTSDLRDEDSEGQASRSTSKSRSNPPPPAQAKGIIAPRRSTRNAPPQKPVDQDKVILVYPQGIPGAVNITNGDLARLQPGEYLNDTLIEFGLKLWLKNLEEKQPELAQQVHIFNSFFYKKLNNKKNEVQAFETVRKWTSKFDIFKKKYIIVPINEHMHWYLAIIYEPEHILSSTAPDETPTRKRTRLSAKVDPEETISISAPEQADVVSSAKSITSSELEIERNLNTDFQSSCNIDVVVDDDIGAEKIETKNEDDSSSDLSYMSDRGEYASRPQPPEDQMAIDNLKEAALDSMDVDEVIQVESGNQDDKIIVPTASTSKSVLEGSTLPRSVSPARFYGKSAKSKGKQKAKAQDDSIDIDVEAQNKTYIFTFDSLGTNHPHAAKKLAQYLRMEAKDKKGIPNAGLATGKTAHVPVQPNFCDCGVYLIHFAQTFLTNPKKYFDIIMSQSKLTSNQEKQEQWNDKQVADLREELSMRIQDLSTLWMKERALKEEEERAQQGSKDPDHINVDNSDDDIEIPSPVKIPKRAARMRG